MNRTEQRLLGPTIKAVIRSCPDSWNRLKYEVFNHGNQSFCPAQSDFYPHVERLMGPFDETTRVALVEAWLAVKPRRKNLSDREILLSYRAMIL
jgi:hypothetical protein